MNSFSDININTANITVNIRLSEFNERFNDAQTWLDTAIMNSMLPFMPKRTGSLVQRTRSISTGMAGTGQICAAASPYGRYQYYGVVMVDPVTGSPWATHTPKQVTGRPLKYSQPNATPKWFETAKAKDLGVWTQGVAERLSGK